MATIKKAMKAQKGKTVSPTYKNLPMGVKNENYQITGVSKNIKPSSSDSARYRGGFEQGMKGKKGMPNEGNIEKMGRWEGQNAGKKKGKMGMTVKKAQGGDKLKTREDVKKSYESSTSPKVIQSPNFRNTTSEIDTVGYSAGRKMFPVKTTKTNQSGTTSKSTFERVGRSIVDKSIKKAQDGVKTLRGVNPPSPSGLTFGKKAGAKKTAKAKSEYESSSNPKVEYNIGKQRIPGGIRGGQNVSMDTTGMAAGKKRFPVKVKMRSGKDVYYETNRSQAKGAVRVSKQKMGGKIFKTSKKK